MNNLSRRRKQSVASEQGIKSTILESISLLNYPPGFCDIINIPYNEVVRNILGNKCKLMIHFMSNVSDDLEIYKHYIA